MFMKSLFDDLSLDVLLNRFWKKNFVKFSTFFVNDLFVDYFVM